MKICKSLNYLRNCSHGVNHFCVTRVKVGASVYEKNTPGDEGLKVRNRG